MYYAFNRSDLAAGPIWTYVAENDAALASIPCQGENTISSSAWAGPGRPVMVAGLASSGSSCIGTLAALDPANGTPKWRVPLQGAVLGAVTEVPGLVAVGAATYLDILSSSTGALLFSYAEPQSGHDTGNGYGDPYWFWAPATFAGNSNLYRQSGRQPSGVHPVAWDSATATVSSRCRFIRTVSSTAKVMTKSLSLAN